MALFGVFGDAARLYVLLWRHSLPAAALAIGAVWAAEAALDQVEGLLAAIVGLTALLLALADHVLSALYYRLTDPERSVIAPRHGSLGSAWDEHALEDARRRT
jgi:hypothetical protein